MTLPAQCLLVTEAVVVSDFVGALLRTKQIHRAPHYSAPERISFSGVRAVPHRSRGHLSRLQTKARSVDNALPQFLADFFALRVDKIISKNRSEKRQRVNDAEEVVVVEKSHRE